MKDEKLESYFIPANYNKSTKFFGLKKRNIIEALAMGIALFNLLDMIPFILKVKLIVMIIVIGPVVILFAAGVKGESITQFIFSYLMFRKKKRILYYKKPGTEDTSLMAKYFRKGENNNAETEIKEQSEFERLIGRFKKRKEKETTSEE